MKGREVREIRERLGKTQAELGDLVGVHWVTVSRWERDVVTIPAPVEKLLRLLAAQSPKRRA
jgi:DNA-binding transcriptional regulator YiaG